MKIFLNILLSLFIFCTIPVDAAADWYSRPNINIGGATAINQLNESVTQMAKKINDGASEMMKFGEMLICNSLHGKDSYTSFTFPDWQISVNNLHFACIPVLISGCILYVLGFFIMMIASFYMFDVAFNLSIPIVLLPLAIALWPFGWTRDKLKDVIESIVYYVGIFIFLPLGILISVKLVAQILTNSFGSVEKFYQIFDEDKSDELRDKLGCFSWSFVQILICYILAIRIIPLMADDFCTHFFGGSLVGSPMSEKMSQVIAATKHATIDKLSKYGSDAIKHQVGKGIQSMGNKNGGFLARVLHRYGVQIGKTRR